MTKILLVSAFTMIAAIACGGGGGSDSSTLERGGASADGGAITGGNTTGDGSAPTRAAITIARPTAGAMVGGRMTMTWTATGVNGARFRATARRANDAAAAPCEGAAMGTSATIDLAACGFAPGDALVLRVDADAAFAETNVRVAGASRGVLYEPDPATNPDDMASYPHAIQLAHSGDANGTILATFERQMSKGTSPGPGWIIYRSTDGGGHFERLAGPIAPAHFNDATNALQPNLLELARPVAGWPAGTLLLAGETGSGSKLEQQVFRSTDHGKSWQFVSTIVSADMNVSPERPWEPFMIQLDDGRIVAFYSDELTPGGSQTIVRKISTDGGATWGAKVDVWASTDPGDRPGMAVVTRMGNGTYDMSVEMIGAPGDFGRAHYKTSTDGLTWGAGAADMGIRAVATTGHVFHGTPYIAWTPAGGPHGTLVLSALAMMKSVSTPDTQAGDFGQTLLVNYDYGNGAWYELTAPIPWTAGATASQAGYRNCLLPLPDATNLLYFATSNTGQGVRNRVEYATASAGGLSFASPFAGDVAVGFQTFGGTWSVSGGVYSNTSGGAGEKAVAGSTSWTDYTVDADVRLDGRGNAGLLVRTSDPSVGVDAHDGYFAGISSIDGTAFVGRENYGWTLLGGAHPIAGGVGVGAWYHVTVKAVGCAFSVSVRPSGSAAAPTTFTETDAGCALRSGAIGVRTFQTPASWRDIRVSAGM